MKRWKCLFFAFSDFNKLLVKTDFAMSVFVWEPIHWNIIMETGSGVWLVWSSPWKEALLGWPMEGQYKLCLCVSFFCIGLVIVVINLLSEKLLLVLLLCMVRPCVSHCGIVCFKWNVMYRWCYVNYYILAGSYLSCNAFYPSMVWVHLSKILVVLFFLFINSNHVVTMDLNIIFKITITNFWT